MTQIEHHHGHPVPSRARLTKALTSLMEAMGAQAATLFLFDRETRAAVLSAATGQAQDEMVAYLGALEPMPAITELDAGETLGGAGIGMLLGAPLGAGPALRGMVYVGICQKRAFSAGEVQRLAELAELLAMHLENARLDATLHKKVEELKAEAELRERFITLLMHDLGAPLAAARLNAQLLTVADQPRGARALGGAIVHSIEQVQRMVGDLLDLHRIRAGQRLPLVLADCNLSTLVREALEGMHAVYGDRFLFVGDRTVRGIWNADQLRRAVWNLCENAIKYGTEDAPVSLTVAPHADGAELTVHNEGPPISHEDQVKLFKPFSGHDWIDGHPRGWGLGLTLIWGCADAHGGRVTVESESDKGTTFRLQIPSDARPYAD